MFVVMFECHGVFGEDFWFRRFGRSPLDGRRRSRIVGRLEVQIQCARNIQLDRLKSLSCLSSATSPSRSCLRRARARQVAVMKSKFPVFDTVGSCRIHVATMHPACFDIFEDKPILPSEIRVPHILCLGLLVPDTLGLKFDSDLQDSVLGMLPDCLDEPSFAWNVNAAVFIDALDVDICDDAEVLDWPVPGGLTFDAEVLDFVIESQSPGVSVPVVPLSSNRRDLPYASGVGRKFFASAYCHATVSARASACKVLGAAILTCEGEVQEAKRLHLPIEYLTSRCALSAKFLVPSTSLEEALDLVLVFPAEHLVQGGVRVDGSACVPAYISADACDIVDAHGPPDLCEVDAHGPPDFCEVDAHGSPDFSEVAAQGPPDPCEVDAHGPPDFCDVDAHGPLVLCEVAAQGAPDFCEVDAHGPPDFCEVDAHGAPDFCCSPQAPGSSSPQAQGRVIMLDGCLSSGSGLEAKAKEIHTYADILAKGVDKISEGADDVIHLDVPTDLGCDKPECRDPLFYVGDGDEDQTYDPVVGDFVPDGDVDEDFSFRRAVLRSFEALIEGDGWSGVAGTRERFRSEFICAVCMAILRPLSLDARALLLSEGALVEGLARNMHQFVKPVWDAIRNSGYDPAVYRRAILCMSVPIVVPYVPDYGVS